MGVGRYSVDAIGRAIGENRLSFTFLEAPSIRYMRRLHEALGLEAPGPADQMREGEADVLDSMPC